MSTETLEPNERLGTEYTKAVALRIEEGPRVAKAARVNNRLRDTNDAIRYLDARLASEDVTVWIFDRHAVM